MEETVLVVLIGSFISSFFIMEILSPYLFSKFHFYQHLSSDQKLEWNSRFLSTIHAAIVTLRTLYVLSFHHFEDLVWQPDIFAFHSIAITTGYIIADLVMLMIYQEKIGGTIGIGIHHLTTIVAYMICLVNRYLVYFANFKLLAEASTVFLNLRWSLVTCGKKTSQLYFYNGLALTSTFFLSRLFIIPFFYREVFNTIGTSTYKEAVSYSSHITWISISIILDVLNFIWFRKLVLGILNYLKQTTNTELSNKQHIS